LRFPEWTDPRTAIFLSSFFPGVKRKHGTFFSVLLGPTTPTAILISVTGGGLAPGLPALESGKFPGIQTRRGFPSKILDIFPKFVNIQFIPQEKGRAEKCGDSFISADTYGKGRSIHPVSAVRSGEILFSTRKERFRPFWNGNAQCYSASRSVHFIRKVGTLSYEPRVTNEAIIIWTGIYLFLILDSGFRRNDNKEPCPSMFVTPANPGSSPGRAPESSSRFFIRRNS
jgi:hypothetical protein